MVTPFTHFSLVKRAGLFAVRFVLLALALLASAVSHASDLSEALRSSEYVLLIRHAYAPGVGDPPNFTLSDCKSQRNLNDEGRKQSLRIGSWLKQQGVASAQVYASPWCRCKDTAELLKFDGFKLEASLASFFNDMSKAKESNIKLQHFIAERIKNKGQQALILVTHHVNIYEYMGENIGSGDMVLVKVNAKGGAVSHTTIRRPD